MPRPNLPKGENGPFEHLRDELGLAGSTFPGKYAQVFWHTNISDFRSYSVSVCFVPRGIDGFDFIGNLNEGFHSLCRAAFKDYGNSVSGWQGTSNELSRLFGSIADCGFTNHEEFFRAIDEFARLEEADWARGIRSGMRSMLDSEEHG